MELTRTNLPRDKVFEWFIGPLLIMKEQIKGLELSEDEEFCLKKLVMRNKNERPEDWDDTGFPSADHVRRAQLQAIIRRYVIFHILLNQHHYQSQSQSNACSDYRLQGIMGSMSRLPTFRRKLKNLVKVLYLEALQSGIIASQGQGGGSSKSRRKGQGSVGTVDTKGPIVTQEERHRHNPQVPEDLV